MNKKDQIYFNQVESSPFSFDQNVAEVFPDMIQRSVPGYARIIKSIAWFAKRFVQPNTVCYDLGCSLGAASLAMSQGIEVSDVEIIGVDNSKAMLERCAIHVNAFKHQIPIKLYHDDILNIDIANASMVVLNFTLQFLAIDQREILLSNIYNGLNDGGVLLLSEKVKSDDPVIDQLLVDLHHQFKRENGYSDLEISQKRNALENVLVPESVEQHIDRLLNAGFTRAHCWMSEFNFVSFVAIK